jgi:hypothetical protein
LISAGVLAGHSQRPQTLKEEIAMFEFALIRRGRF